MSSCSAQLAAYKGSRDPADLDKLIECLEERITNVAGDLERAANSADKFASAIGRGSTLASSISQSFINSQKELGKFLNNLQAQYILSEDIAKSYKKLSVNIGIGYQNQERLGESFTASLIKVRELGGDIEDVNSIYSRFAENSGRVRILSDEEVERIFAIERSTGLLGDSASALAERFDLMGIGSKEFSENINDIMIDSQKMGLNSSKVVKVLSDNFEGMQRMSFKGGVKAMTEMSKLSVKMRMNISDMLGMADRFYEPEAAIEAAANLQLLGGEIANSFGDPLQMMFEARNAPEELMERVGDVTKGLVKFNEETGQFDLLAENRQKLLGMADALGLNKDQLIDTAFQMNKMQRIKMDVGGSLFDDEEKLDKIASIAKFDSNTQQWMVDIGGKPIAVEELNSDQLEQALAAPTDEKDAAIITAKAAMTTNDLLEAIVESNKVAIVAETKLYETLEEGLKPLLESTSKADKQIVKEVGEAVKDSEFGEKMQKTIDFATDEFKSAADGISYFTNALEQFKLLNPLEDDRVGASGNVPTGKIPSNNDATVKPVLNTGGDISSFDPGDEFLVGKSGGPLSGYLAEMNQKLNQTIATPTVPSVNAPQKMDIGGTLNFGDITISLDGSTETLSFSDSDKKEMMKSIKNEIIKGTTSMLSGGYTDGKTANTNI